MTNNNQYKVRPEVPFEAEQERVYSKDGSGRCRVLAVLDKWPKVFENRFNPGKAEVKLLVLKGSLSAKALMKAAGNAVKEGVKDGIIPQSQAHIVKNGEPAGVTNINDCDLQTESGEEFEDYKHGNWILRAHSNNIDNLTGTNPWSGKPNCFTWVESGDGTLEMAPAGRGDFLGGNLVFADLCFKAYKTGSGRGVTVYLNGLEKYADGEILDPLPAEARMTPPAAAPTRFSTDVMDKIEAAEEEAEGATGDSPQPQPQTQSKTQESFPEPEGIDWDSVLSEDDVVPF